jgi:hypothetical protein
MAVHQVPFPSLAFPESAWGRTAHKSTGMYYVCTLTTVDVKRGVLGGEENFFPVVLLVTSRAGSPVKTLFFRSQPASQQQTPWTRPTDMVGGTTGLNRAPIGRNPDWANGTGFSRNPICSDDLS